MITLLNNSLPVYVKKEPEVGNLFLSKTKNVDQLDKKGGFGIGDQNKDTDVKTKNKK